MLKGAKRKAHNRGVGDVEDVTRLEIRHLNEGNDLLPRGDKVFLPSLRSSHTGEAYRPDSIR